MMEMQVQQVTFKEVCGEDCREWIYCDECAEQNGVEKFRDCRARMRFAIDQFAYDDRLAELRIRCANEKCATVLQMDRKMRAEMVK